MSNISNFVGIDIAADDFSTAGINNPDSELFSIEKISNDIDGFSKFLKLLKEHNFKESNTIISLEATGVYGENISYFLSSKGYRVALVDPRKVKESINDSPRKNDLLDAKRIAEYAFRYTDKLSEWKPRDAIIEQLKVLLSTRESFVKQLNENQNALGTITRKYYQTPKANQAYQSIIEQLKAGIKSLDNEIKKIINKDDSFKKTLSLLLSVPGVGVLLASNIMVLTNGFTSHLNYREVASYIGICPYEKTSGRTLYKRPRSKRYGPARLRKLLYLASLSVRTHNQSFKKYFLRKTAEGKPSHLVLNNIANKLLKIIFAVLKTETVFINNYKSINPILLKTS